MCGFFAVIGSGQELLDPRSWVGARASVLGPLSPLTHTRAHLLSSSTSSTSSSKSFSNGDSELFPMTPTQLTSTTENNNMHKLTTG